MRFDGAGQQETAKKAGANVSVIGAIGGGIATVIGWALESVVRAVVAGLAVAGVMYGVGWWLSQ